MRILSSTPLYWPYIGGLEAAVMTQLAALRDRGHVACVMTSHDALLLPDEDEHDGVAIHRLPLRAAIGARDPMALLASQRRATAVRRAFAPDVMQINLPDPAAAVYLRAAAAHPAPMIVTVHTSILIDGDGDDTLFGSLLRTADWVSAPSMAVLRPLLAVMPSLEERSSVIPYGLPDAAPPVEPPSVPTILCIGRLIPEKGIDLAIAALAALSSAIPSARLVIAGDGPERERLERQARDLGVARRVDFLGWISHERMPAVIAGASVVVVPSRWQEAFGMVAIEAAWQGRPTVAARVGGLPEPVADGETGFVVAPEDSAALARAIATLLTDRRLAARMGTAARARASTYYGVERYADDYEQLYQHLTTTRMHVRIG
jgi:glycosyltransferase involved in cell wall biosynthesis